MYCLNQSGKLKMPCISTSPATACGCHVDQDTQELFRPHCRSLLLKVLLRRSFPHRSQRQISTKYCPNRGQPSAKGTSKCMRDSQRSLVKRAKWFSRCHHF